MAQQLKFTVTDPVGLYATPTTELVNTVKQFHSDITLEYGSKVVNLKSMMGVLSLGVPTKAALKIVAIGEDENQAIKVIQEKIIELGISTIE
ncbi:MAG: HPr family phosphocarrier protein [Anaerorhabdus sp.]